MTPQVMIIMGSKSDFPKMKKAFDMLDELEIPYAYKIFSAHRTPIELIEYIASVNCSECDAIIAGAGMSAALPGVIAAQTLIPVIGVPLSGSNLEGMDALLSIVQMPPGIPVATVGIDATKNAALLAAQLVALNDSDVARKLLDFRKKQNEAVLKCNEEQLDADFKFLCNW